MDGVGKLDHTDYSSFSAPLVVSVLLFWDSLESGLSTFGPGGLSTTLDVKFLCDSGTCTSPFLSINQN